MKLFFRARDFPVLHIFVLDNYGLCSIIYISCFDLLVRSLKVILFFVRKWSSRREHCGGSYSRGVDAVTALLRVGVDDELLGASSLRTGQLVTLLFGSPGVGNFLSEVSRNLDASFKQFLFAAAFILHCRYLYSLGFVGVVAVLVGYLGQYVKDIQKEQLKITLWNEEVLLENVELILEAFDYLRLPFALKQGRVGRLSIKIPWKKLGWDPIIIVLEDVFISASQRGDQEWSANAVEKRDFAGKKAKLAAAELGKLSRRVCGSHAGQSFISYITAKSHVMIGLKFSSLTIMKQHLTGLIFPVAVAIQCLAVSRRSSFLPLQLSPPLHIGRTPHHRQNIGFRPPSGQNSSICRFATFRTFVCLIDGTVGKILPPPAKPLSFIAGGHHTRRPSNKEEDW
ncbi:putative vacuolar protein sorting-associated protein 13A [Senna tora]|uniref:Putative vacuolar protein sorting-associated protein 13A n=1 Tax=Senna tora TaxID=362788 RepID=A0A834TPL3_9FABA|nr:putative vacuolar protein sorting-associated protein 13A [Senna tora]